MAVDPPSGDPRVIAAYLDDVELDLDAVKRLITDPPNRLAAFHLQQAAEKLVKAIQLDSGLQITAEDNIGRLLEKLSVDEVWRRKLTVLEPLSSYATSYCYPSLMGKREGGPSTEEVLGWIKTIAGLCAQARVLVGSRDPGLL